jgi:hypothetical protein
MSHANCILVWDVFNIGRNTCKHKYLRKYSVSSSVLLQYTDQEMIPARNARNVVMLAEVMFVTIQRENILPSKITDY